MTAAPLPVRAQNAPLRKPHTIPGSRLFTAKCNWIPASAKDVTSVCALSIAMGAVRSGISAHQGIKIAMRITMATITMVPPDRAAPQIFPSRYLFFPALAVRKSTYRLFSSSWAFPAAARGTVSGRKRSAVSEEMLYRNTAIHGVPSKEPPDSTSQAR